MPACGFAFCEVRVGCDVGARADLGDSLTKHPGPGRREPGRVAKSD